MDEFDLGFDMDTPGRSRTFPDDSVTDSQFAQNTTNSEINAPAGSDSSQGSVRIPEIIVDGSQILQRVDTLREFGVFNTSSTANPAELEQDRFADVSEEDIAAYAAGNVNENTKRCTQWGERAYNRWRETYEHYHNGVHVPTLAEMNRESVKKWVSLFIMAARTKDGKSYPRGTLHALACALKRRMVELKVPDINFMDEKDTDFKQVRDVLDRRMKDVTAEGVGVHRKKAKGVSEAEEQQLWDQGIFGMVDATSLQNTVFFYLTKIFALRGGTELRQVKIADFQFSIQPTGKVVTFKGGKCKTFHGGLSQLKQEPKTVTHISPHGANPCIVSILQTYIDAIGGVDPFFRKPLKPLAGQQYRYSEQAIGHNSLSKKMAQICKSAGFDGYYTNHSGRRTIASQMFNAGLDEQLIMDRTGHRSVQGVREYKQTQETTVVKVSTLVGPPPKTARMRQSLLEDFAGASSSSVPDAPDASGVSYPTRKDKELLYASTPRKRAVPLPTELVESEHTPGTEIGMLNFDIGLPSGSVTAASAPPTGSAAPVATANANRVEQVMKAIFSANVIKDNNINIHFH